MRYKIVITKMIDNPNFQNELEEYRKNDSRSRYIGSSDVLYPERMLSENALATILSEKQFEAIRKATLEQF
jgi:hypothetical protein